LGFDLGTLCTVRPICGNPLCGRLNGLADYKRLTLRIAAA
jgi:hypothetical protein